MSADDEVVLAGEFPAASRQEWQRLVSGVLAKSGRPDLSGAAAEEALAAEPEPGLRVRALYTAADAAGLDPGWPGFAPFTRGGQATGTSLAGWDVRQRHAGADPERVNAAVHADLDSGVTSVWLALGAAGLAPEALPDALKGVDLAKTGVVLDAGAEFAAAAAQLIALHSIDQSSIDQSSAGQGREGKRKASVAACLGADPLGLAARSGDDALAAAQLADAAGLAARCAVGSPGLRAVVADALPYHEAGATAARELGLSLSTAVAYLRELTAAGLSADAAAGQLEFRYAATADQFLTIAKLRAARRLWSRVAGACGIDLASPDRPAAQRQHAVTSALMMTEEDPWVNMLRATVACLAAGLGGADAVTVLPSDTALAGNTVPAASTVPAATTGPGLPDDFARRIARNTQAILLDEAHLGRVIDPAGGSGYVERLTDDLARAAWSVFQEVERAGGHLAALRSGLIFDQIAQDGAAR